MSHLGTQTYCKCKCKCKNPNYCYLEMLEKDNKISKYNHGEKYTKVPFVIYADPEFLLEEIDTYYRGGSRTAATSKMERFVIKVNGWKPLTIMTKRSILDVVAVLDPPLYYNNPKKSSTAIVNSHYRM